MSRPRCEATISAGGDSRQCRKRATFVGVDAEDASSYRLCDEHAAGFGPDGAGELSLTKLRTGES